MKEEIELLKQLIRLMEENNKMLQAMQTVNVKVNTVTGEDLYKAVEEIGRSRTDNDKKAAIEETLNNLIEKEEIEL